MAEDETPSAAATAAETQTVTENADSKPENGKGRKNREDEVPVEELFDLSQPIPRVSVGCDRHMMMFYREESFFVCY